MIKGYLFFDYDGTLSDKMEPPTKRIIKALNDVQAAGYKIFVCSGRCRSMLPAIEGVNFDGYVLACGTDVTVGDKCIVNFLCDNSSLRECVELAIKNNSTVVTEGERYAVTINGVSYWRDSPRVKDFDEYLEKYGDIALTNKFSIMNPCGSEYISAADRNGFVFIDHVKTGEFVPKGFSKETGIKAVLEMFGADRKDVTAFGDSMNDYDMLQFAGTGVAMGNSVKGLKQIADFVAPSVKDDGVATYIYEKLLNI